LRWVPQPTRHWSPLQHARHPLLEDSCPLLVRKQLWRRLSWPQEWHLPWLWSCSMWICTWTACTCHGLTKPLALRSSPVKARSALRRHSRISRGISWSPSNPLKENFACIKLWSLGSLHKLTAARSSFLMLSIGSGTNGRTGFLLVSPNSFMVEQIQSKIELFCNMTICGLTSKCTALKATGLLSCLWMEIVSFEMKLKWMWCLREVQLEILGAVLSLLSWTMLLREESAC